ncbi:unnamed protein product [Schistosoma rodhaini]|uniref:Peptidase M14 domain-containing protein n=1 Tax=Schistosoma rodhaini TaxID=6188 RepID=A0AA85GI21_9TREM|nr:unnamed protein product [Schistosoma rodhaini]
MEEKLKSYMISFASYCSEANAVKCKEEDLLSLRANVKKISSLLSSSNKCRRMIFEHESYASDFAFALQFLNDRVLRTQIVLILFKLVKKSASQSRTTMLIQKGITRALFQALYTEYSEETPNVELLLKIHQLLCRLGPMDKRFGIRARLSHCIPITIHLLRIQVALLNSSIRTTPSRLDKHLKNLSDFSFCYSSMNLDSFQSNAKHIHTINEMLHNHHHHTTMPTVSSVIRRNLNIILHMTCLYASDGGKTNSYLLGRNGVIKLLIQLIALLSGLHIYWKSSTMNSLLSPSTATTTTTTTTTRKTTVSPTDTPAYNSMKATRNPMNEYRNHLYNNSQLSSPTLRTSDNNMNENELIINSPVRYIVIVMASMKALLKYLYQNENESFLNDKAESTKLHNHMITKFHSINNPNLINSIRSFITSKPKLIAIGVKHNVKLLRLLVNTLYCLIKYKNNAIRANNNHAVPLLLDLFLDIHRCDLHWDWIDLQRSLLNCLKRLTGIHSGRKALMKSGGLYTLYAICIGYIGPDPLKRTNDDILLKMFSQYKNIKSSIHYNEQLNLSINQYNQLQNRTHLTTTTTMDPIHNIDSSTIKLPSSLSSSSSSSTPAEEASAASSSSSTPAKEAPLSSTSIEKASSSTLSHKTNYRKVNPSYIIDNDPNRIHKKDQIILDPIKILIQTCILLRRCNPRCSLPLINAESILNCLLPSNDASLTSLLRQNSESPIQKDTSASPETEKPNAAKFKFNPQISYSTNMNSTSNSNKKSHETPLSHKSSPTNNIIKFTINRKSLSKLVNPISSDYFKLLCNTTTINSNDNHHYYPKITRKKLTDERKQSIRIQNKRITSKLNSPMSKNVPKITNLNSKDLHSKSITDLYTINQSYNPSIDTFLHPPLSKQFNKLFISQSCTELPNTQQLNKFCRIQKVKILRRGEDESSNQPEIQQDFNYTKKDKLPVICDKPISYQLLSSSNTSLTSPEIFDINEQNTQNIDGDDVDDNEEEEVEDEDDNDDEDDGDDDFNVTKPEDSTTTSQRHTFNELISSHLKFFPEWFDLPSEIPNRLMKEQVEKPLDMNSVNWPYECNYPNSNINKDPTTNKHNTFIKDNTIMEYYYFAQIIKTLLPFETIAYPDLIDAHGSINYEPFYETDQSIWRYFNQQTNLYNSTTTSSQVTSSVNDDVDNDGDDECVHLSKIQEADVSIHPMEPIPLTKSAVHHLNKLSKSVKLNKTMNQSLKNDQSLHIPYHISDFPHTEILDDVRRFIDSNDLINRVVYDLDELIRLQSNKDPIKMSQPLSSQQVFSSFKQQCHQFQEHQQQRHLSISKNKSYQEVIPTSCVQMNNHSIDSSSLDGGNKMTSSNHQQDNLCSSSVTSSSLYDFNLSNQDELLISQFDVEKGHLEFESRFECGNLRKAIQVRQYEYDLILNPDINTTSYIQWFYFRISNMESNISYRFNIINCEKVDSQFNAGMQPLLFSVHESLQSHPCWKRVGSNIIYYRNHFTRHLTRKCNVDSGTYYTATFTIRFPYTGDICYLAYHYPYTYTRLLTDLNKWQYKMLNHSNEIYFHIQQLTSTILSNPVPLITITQTPDSSDESTNINQRPYIILTCRVHPGESNSSWIMKGIIEQLLSNNDRKMNELRKMFIFKIIPMLNPDGVIVGNHRCSMSGKDLNRHWINPSSLIHPTIYHTKMLMEFLTLCERSPYIFIDFHGHSRMKNIFLYGCSSIESWLHPDIHNPAYCGINQSEDHSYRLLADILDQLSPYFSKQSCLYVVSKAKETTARIAVWRQFNVLRSYTIEASYCGIRRKWRRNQVQEKEQQGNDNGTEKEKHSNKSVEVIQHQIRPVDLMNFGSQLLKAFLLLSEETTSNTSKTVSSMSSSPSLMTSSASLYNVSSPEHPSSSLSFDYLTDTNVMHQYGEDDTDVYGYADNNNNNDSNGGEKLQISSRLQCSKRKYQSKMKKLKRHKQKP